MKTNTKALVLFSGGQDSAVCLAHGLNQYSLVETIGFHYGQNHDVEMLTRTVFLTKFRTQFTDMSKNLGPDHVVDLTGFGKIGHSSLTRETAAKRRKDGLPDTYVPGRNLIFLTAAAAMADRRGMDVLIGGMCETDFSGYPDCRRHTMDAMEKLIELGMELPLQIDTPLMKLTKAETWELAKTLGGQNLVDLIVRDTHTCYRGDRSKLHEWGYGCGQCDACTLRARGYHTWKENAPDAGANAP